MIRSLQGGDARQYCQLRNDDELSAQMNVARRCSVAGHSGGQNFGRVEDRKQSRASGSLREDVVPKTKYTQSTPGSKRPGRLVFLFRCLQANA